MRGANLPSFLMLLVLSVLACSGTNPVEVTPVEVSQEAAPGLLEVVRLSSAGPRYGETIELRSTLHNQTAAPIEVWATDDCLRVGGSLRLNTNQIFGCIGPLQTIAPGDSLPATQLGVVWSPPGHYTLDVMQVAEVWVTFDVWVRQ